MTSPTGRIGRRPAIQRTYLGPGAITTARTPAELETEAWRHVSTLASADQIAARDLAAACGLTLGGALAYLTTWTRTGHLTRTPASSRPAPYDDPHTHTGTPASRTASRSAAPQEVPMPDSDTTARRDALIPAALDYAARGWHVFPLRPGDKRPAFPDHTADRCTGTDPRCARAGHHVGWQERATTDPSRIRRAWQATTPAGAYGIGIACGPSRLVVLDLDTPKPSPGGHLTPAPPPWDQPGIIDGCDVLAALCETAGHPFPIGDTWTVRTGRGGLHLYWQAPPPVEGVPELRCTAGQLGWLIDTRAAGGYVVAPPTIVGGNPYRIDWDGPVAPLPGWLATALTPAPLPAQQPVTVALNTEAGGDGDLRRAAYLATAIERQLAAVTTTTTGGRNRALYLSAVALGQLVAGGHLEPDDITARLEHAARHVGLEPTETARTIASGLRAGANRPRTLTTPHHPMPAESSLGAAA